MASLFLSRLTAEAALVLIPGLARRRGRARDRRDQGRKARKRYSLLNRREVRGPVIKAAAKRYGYRTGQVELRLYVGKFSTDAHEERVRRWATRQRVGAGPIGVYGLADVVGVVRQAAVPRAYRDHPVLVTMKVLEAAGMLSAP